MCQRMSWISRQLETAFPGAYDSTADRKIEGAGNNDVSKYEQANTLSSQQDKKQQENKYQIPSLFNRQVNKPKALGQRTTKR